ncbi:MAG: VanW family protein [Bacillota bacterium]
MEDRTGAALFPRLRMGLAGLLLLGILGLAGLASASPRYLLRVNGELLLETRAPEALKAALSGWADQALSRPVTLEYEGQRWSYPARELGLSLPLEEAGARLAAAIARRGWWQREVMVELELPASWETARLEAALAPVRAALERPPVPASLEVAGDAVRIIPSVDGRRVEAAAVARALGSLEGDRLPLPVRSVPPDLTTAGAEAMGIRRLVAAWTTHYDPAIPRAENVERAARALDGLMLKPGEILSYNAVVGPIDARSGWREAYVIHGGELVPGIGGGVCQVATTLYGAALRANMEILERHPHQLAVSYIPPSEDAAVAQGYQDLKIRNTTPGHLLVRTESGGGSVTIRLYGDLPAGQTVQIQSRVTGSLPVPTRLVQDSSLAPGQRVTVSPGAPGITSEAYRLLFMDGELVRRELLSRDRYLPTAAVVRSGPASSGAE